MMVSTATPIPQLAEKLATHRALQLMSSSELAHVSVLMSEAAYGLSERLPDLSADPQTNATEVNRYLGTSFKAIHEALDECSPETLEKLRQEYFQVLQADPKKFESMASAFPKFAAKYYDIEKLAPKNIETSHLAYMILGSMIRFTITAFKEAGGSAAIYDPDNIITASTRIKPKAASSSAASLG